MRRITNLGMISLLFGCDIEPPERPPATDAGVAAEWTAEESDWQEQAAADAATAAEREPLW